MIDRNAPCFCGSGMKQKRCHPETGPQSCFADIIRLYKKIDDELLKTKNPSGCHAGCSNCCETFFAVSSAEFYYAMWGAMKKGIDLHKILQVGYDIWLVFAKRYPKVAEMLSCKITGPKQETYLQYNLKLYEMIQDKSLPCVFLNDKDKQCSIYEYRPLICCYHGMGFIENVEHNTKMVFCEKIQQALT